MARPRIALLVFCLAWAPWLTLIHGNYLHDDIQLIEGNPRLAAVNKFSDTFSFTLKPSKPVSTWLLAAAHVAGGGKVEGQRILSLALHGTAAALLFWLLSASAPLALAALLAVWFAWSPLHSEALAVAWFRMDVVGTVFALLAAVLARAGKWRTAVLAVVLSALSKEVFALLAPAAVFAATGKKRALWLALPSGVAVAGLLLLDRGEYSYAGVIGPRILGIDQIWLGPIATAEWFLKVLFGRNLTTTSLLERAKAGELALGTLLFGLGLWVACYRWARASRWAAALFAGLMIYAAIPNLNIGAERYGYFPAACLALALAPFFVKRDRTTWAFAAAYAVVMILPLKARTSELETRVSHALAELHRHPGVAASWSNTAVAYLELPGDEFLREAGVFLSSAKALEPENPRIWLAEFAYHFRKKDRAAFEALYKERAPGLSAYPRLVSGLQEELKLLGTF